MKSRNQIGAAHVSVLVAAVMTVLFFLTLVMALVFFMGKSDLQKNIDTKVEEQLATETTKIEAKKDAELAEKEKLPTKTYTGPATVGSVTFAYPKTYSGYVEESQVASGNALNGYFQPNVVPKDDTKTLFAIRVQVTSNSYDTELRNVATQITTGKAKATPYRAAAVPSILGSRIDGEIAFGKQGILVILPVRDKTLKIWTESKDAFADFEKFVLPSLTFVP